MFPYCGIRATACRTLTLGGAALLTLELCSVKALGLSFYLLFEHDAYSPSVGLPECKYKDGYIITIRLVLFYNFQAQWHRHNVSVVSIFKTFVHLA